MRTFSCANPNIDERFDIKMLETPRWCGGLCAGNFSKPKKFRHSGAPNGVSIERPEPSPSYIQILGTGWAPTYAGVVGFLEAPFNLVSVIFCMATLGVS